jgi:cyclohexyl-isocyanide hydratase
VDYAQAVQLAIEYAPAPPFDCGRPGLASASIVAAARTKLDAIRGERDAAVGRAAARLKGGGCGLSGAVSYVMQLSV